MFRLRLNKIKNAFKELAQKGQLSKTIFHHRDSARSFKLNSKVDAIITSPPYQTAVDYYRQHTLESYWLGLVNSPEDRATIRDMYLGRARVPIKHAFFQEQMPSSITAEKLLKRMKKEDPQRANDLHHYVVGISKFLNNARRAVTEEGKVIVVVGNSNWRGEVVRTDDMIIELSSTLFKKVDTFKYPVKNKYMSYTRHNGADIAEEVGIVLSGRKI